MEWQAVVLAMQILLLAVGWMLFQRAKSELSAHAAETPVLSEIRALQRNARQLLAEIQDAADQASARLETRCGEAQSLLRELQQQQSALESLENRLAARLESPVPQKSSGQRGGSPRRAEAVVAASERPATPAHTGSESPGNALRQQVYALADAGRSAPEIARETAVSEGEVETLLGLRPARAGS